LEIRRHRQHDLPRNAVAFIITIKVGGSRDYIQVGLLCSSYIEIYRWVFPHLVAFRVEQTTLTFHLNSFLVEYS
jgi:hypothetical protein